jgi:hypothetical protein
VRLAAREFKVQLVLVQLEVADPLGGAEPQAFKEQLVQEQQEARV